MIRSTAISNFQSHKNSEIEFSEGLNIITGASDAGKSAIIRALLWAITNKPSGDSYRNWDIKDPVKVKIDFDDGWISKDRSGPKNTYETELGRLEAFRTDIPEEIQNVTKITEFNIQTQHQPYFLLQDSPGEVARKLNDLVGLDVIDRLYKNIGSKISDKKSRVKFSSERISNFESQIENLSYLDEISIIIDELDKDASQLEIVRQRVQSVRNLLSSLAVLNSKIYSTKNILKLEPFVKGVQQRIKDLSDIKSDQEVLNSVVSKLKKVTAHLESEREWLAVEPEYKKVTTLITDIKKKQEDFAALGKLLGLIDKATTSISTSSSITSLKIRKYLTLLREHKICPVCSSPIEAKVIKRIEEGFG